VFFSGAGGGGKQVVRDQQEELGRRYYQEVWFFYLENSSLNLFIPMHWDIFFITHFELFIYLKSLFILNESN
jgi:hypothetical protein